LLRSSLKTIWSSISIHWGAATWKSTSTMNKIKTSIDSRHCRGWEGLPGAGRASTVLILSSHSRPIQGIACPFSLMMCWCQQLCYHCAFKPAHTHIWLPGMKSDTSTTPVIVPDSHSRGTPSWLCFLLATCCVMVVALAIGLHAGIVSLIQMFLSSSQSFVCMFSLPTLIVYSSLDHGMSWPGLPIDIHPQIQGLVSSGRVPT
jgi:hypothetical protein